jgi:hypothetical protein
MRQLGAAPRLLSQNGTASPPMLAACLPPVTDSVTSSKGQRLSALLDYAQRNFARFARLINCA